MAQVQPGEVPVLHLGGNYAQPSCSSASLPSGNSTARALCWSGRGNQGAPIMRDQDVTPADARTEFGEIGGKLHDTSNLASLEDELQLAREFAQYVLKPSVRQSSIVTSFAVMMRDADD